MSGCVEVSTQLKHCDIHDKQMYLTLVKYKHIRTFCMTPPPDEWCKNTCPFHGMYLSHYYDKYSLRSKHHGLKCGHKKYALINYCKSCRQTFKEHYTKTTNP